MDKLLLPSTRKTALVTALFAACSLSFATYSLAADDSSGSSPAAQPDNTSQQSQPQKARNQEHDGNNPAQQTQKENARTMGTEPNANDNSPRTTTQDDAHDMNTEHSWIDRTRMGQYEDQKDALEEQLKGASSVDELRSRLDKAGYMITSINEQSDDEVEYEIVKGNHTFEVQADIDDGVLEDIEVSHNLWRADETKKAMTDPDYRAGNVKYDKDNRGKYSDSQYAESWNKEKEALEALLPTGKIFDDYQKTLKDKGYRITSMNEVDSGKIEFEVVKGEHSFEVQLDRDKNTKKITDVDVSRNIWASEETEKALGDN